MLSYRKNINAYRSFDTISLFFSSLLILHQNNYHHDMSSVQSQSVMHCSRRTLSRYEKVKQVNNGRLNMYRKLVIVVSIDWDLCLRLVLNTGQTGDSRKHRQGFMLTTRRKHLTNWRSLLRKRNRKLAIIVSLAWIYAYDSS